MHICVRSAQMYERRGLQNIESKQTTSFPIRFQAFLWRLLIVLVHSFNKTFRLRRLLGTDDVEVQN